MTLFMVYICVIMARLAIIIIIALPVVLGRGQHVFIILPLIVSMILCPLYNYDSILYMLCNMSMMSSCYR